MKKLSIIITLSSLFTTGVNANTNTDFLYCHDDHDAINVIFNGFTLEIDTLTKHNHDIRNFFIIDRVDKVTDSNELIFNIHNEDYKGSIDLIANNSFTMLINNGITTTQYECSTLNKETTT